MRACVAGGGMHGRGGMQGWGVCGRGGACMAEWGVCVVGEHA